MDESFTHEAMIPSAELDPALAAGGAIADQMDMGIDAARRSGHGGGGYGGLVSDWGWVAQVGFDFVIEQSIFLFDAIAEVVDDPRFVG